MWCKPRVPKAFGIYVAASLGFEPRQRDSESLVLPLHHEARARKLKTDSPRCKSRALVFRNFGRRRFLPRAAFRCLPGLLRFPAAFRSLPPVRERIPASRPLSRRRDAGHGEKAPASESPPRAPAKRRWRSNYVPIRCGFYTLRRCTARRESEYRCRAEIAPARLAHPPQFPSPVPDSADFHGVHGEKIHTARDQAGKRLSRRWRKCDNRRRPRDDLRVWREFLLYLGRTSCRSAC